MGEKTNTDPLITTAKKEGEGEKKKGNYMQYKNTTQCSLMTHTQNYRPKKKSRMEAKLKSGASARGENITRVKNKKGEKKEAENRGNNNNNNNKDEEMEENGRKERNSRKQRDEAINAGK